MRDIFQLHIHHTYKPDYSDFYGTNKKGIQKQLAKRYRKKAWWEDQDLKIHKRILNSIKRFHIKVRGWRDSGYHEEVFPDGVWMKARNIKFNPASIAGYNKGAVAIVMIGNFDYDLPFPEQWETLIQRSVYYIKKYDILEEFWIFHNEKSLKTCPGRRISKAEFIEAVKERL